MVKFDFTPIVQKQGLTIVKHLGLMAAPFVVLAFVVSPGMGMSFLQGVVLGGMDTLIMLHGINKALPYVKTPKKGLAVMRRYRWYRLAACSSIILLLLKQGAEVLGTFFGLVLVHIFLLIQLIFIAYRLNNDSGVD